MLMEGLRHDDHDFLIFFFCCPYVSYIFLACEYQCVKAHVLYVCAFFVCVLWCHPVLFSVRGTLFPSFIDVMQ